MLKNKDNKTSEQIEAKQTNPNSSQVISRKRSIKYSRNETGTRKVIQGRSSKIQRSLMTITNYNTRNGE